MKKIGVQLYTIRDFMGDEESIRTSFKKLKAMGYDQAQTAGCTIPYETFGRIAQEEVFEIVGTHDDFGMMLNEPERAMAAHRALGTTNMGVGGVWGGFDDYTRFIEQANQVAANVHPQGFKFTYHNHSHEFIRRPNGKTLMEMLVEGLDPEGTSFVLDTFWVQHGGADVRHWIEKLAGRIDILHLKDMGRNEKGPFITEIGHGNLWWDGIIKTAEETGVQYFVVEQDEWPGDPFESLKYSREYLDRFIR